ncbi:hypothetical protein FFLO_07147 [Filobasidium floriforme]|uniref:Uncharacterized protein n=1 Tax=Filobasidium floriforme TaxID=5210 RepID=A0A8K0JDV6_9TREE|nr:uncharacterized protein HD553DRAFT_346420 [Filobasidium floriforme]KAG7527225.1 hypothetical protein FFLO_07147 [Filobasidium floriforme]KAH8077775.1 hypothetical protein HD553DRAFT_346420 [Filobasidium floriforme]
MDWTVKRTGIRPPPRAHSVATPSAAGSPSPMNFFPDSQASTSTLLTTSESSTSSVGHGTKRRRVRSISPDDNTQGQAQPTGTTQHRYTTVNHRPAVASPLATSPPIVPESSQRPSAMVIGQIQNRHHGLQDLTSHHRQNSLDMAVPELDPEVASLARNYLADNFLEPSFDMSGFGDGNGAGNQFGNGGLGQYNGGGSDQHGYSQVGTSRDGNGGGDWNGFSQALPGGRVGENDYSQDEYMQDQSQHAHWAQQQYQDHDGILGSYGDKGKSRQPANFNAQDSPYYDNDYAH